MRTTKKTKVAAAVATGVVVAAGLGAVGALAASSALSPSEESQAVIDDAAAQLGVESDALSDALKEALENQLDEAVDAGRLTEEQAEMLKERLGSPDVPLLFGHRGRTSVVPSAALGHFELLSDAAAYLGLTETELREALADKTLAEIAEEQGKTERGLVQSLVATAEKRIDEAERAGRITEEQATELKAGLEERIEQFVDGELRGPAFGRRHWFEHGSGMPRAPPLFGGETT